MGYTFINEQSALEGIIPVLLSRDIWGVDTETTGLDPHKNKVVLLQIGDESTQYVIDTRRVNVEPLRPLLESKDIRKILHNAKFDYKMLRGNYGICMEKTRDTYLAEKVLHAGRKFSGYGLDDVVKTHLDMDMDKSIRASFGDDSCLTGDFTREQIEYSAKDVEVLLKVLAKQRVLMQADGVEQTWLLECDALPCFGDMEFDGMNLDQKAWREIIESNESDALTAEKEMDEIALKVMDKDLFNEVHVNWASPEQVVEVLKRLRIKTEIKNELTGKYERRLITKSDDKTLKKAKDNRIVQLIKKYRSHTIRVTTFGHPYLKAINSTTGRLHPEYEQVGTETGRIAARGKVNLLNIPRDKEFRKCFGGEHYELVQTDDYSGCELRIWAEISGDPQLVEAFAKGIDVHCHVGTKLFGKEVTKKAPERNLAKTLNFGAAYGMSAYSLYEKLNGEGYVISREEAKGLYARYEDEFRTGLEFLRSSGRKALEEGCLANMNGRRRYWIRPDPTNFDKYPGGRYDKTYKGRCAGIQKEGGNFLIQSVNADMTKLAMIKIRDYIKKNNVRSKFMNQIYDEIVTRTHKDDSEDFHIVKKKLMLEAAHKYLKKVPMEVEGVSEPYWTK